MWREVNNDEKIGVNKSKKKSGKERKPKKKWMRVIGKYIRTCGVDMGLVGRRRKIRE